ncbi:MAG: hypothetical protein ACTHXA_09800 [Gulosibacter sp.]
MTTCPTSVTLAVPLAAAVTAAFSPAAVVTIAATTHWPFVAAIAA